MATQKPELLKDEDDPRKPKANPFLAAKDVLDGIKMADAQARAIREGKADWSKAEDVAFSESVDRAERARRERPRDNKCPNCKEYVEGRWVYECEGAPLCWGCFLAGGGKRGRVCQYGEHVVLDGAGVRACRERRAWSRRVLALKLGKTGPWVQAIEAGDIRIKPEMQPIFRAVFSAP